MIDRIPASDRSVEISDNLMISTTQLVDSNDSLLSRLEQIEQKAAKVPRISSDEESGPWQEVIADADSLGRDIEATRLQTKDPFEKAVEIANGFFFGLFAPRRGQTPGRLNLARGRIVKEVQEHLMRKEAEARAERERIAEQERQRERDAIAAREKAERERLAAEEEGRRRAAANASNREAQAAADASAANARAFEAEQQAQARPAELARTRSDGGTLATLRVTWDFRIDDIDKVKGAPLWEHVTRAAKEAAIRAYIRANAPKTILTGQEGQWQPLAGVTMVPKRDLMVR